LLFLCPVAWAQGPATPTSTSSDAYVELFRSDGRKQAASLVGQGMQLSADEAVVFWPVYKRYEADYSKLGDDKVALIKDFAANYNQMTDAKATELVNRAFDLQDRSARLKKKYYLEFAKALPALKAARWVQIENQIERLIDLQVAAQLPLIQ
jgi:hypothetical protein